jgi:hypothetical protein
VYVVQDLGLVVEYLQCLSVVVDYDKQEQVFPLGFAQVEANFFSQRD